MKTRAVWMMGVALVLASGSVYLAQGWLESQVQQPVAQVPGPEMTTVVVADTPLGFGSAVRREHLRVVSWPVAAKPEGSFTEVAEVIGEDGAEARVALRAITAGEPVLKSKVSGFGGRASLSTVIDADMRASTIRVNDVNGVAGFVLPGDRVDVMITRDVGKKDMITDLLLQNLKVLAIDQDADQETDQPKLARAVTLEVTPEQAQKLVLAQQIGQLSLSLRNLTDTQAATARTVSVRDLRIGEANNVEDKPAEKPKAATRVRPTQPKQPSVRIVRGTDSKTYSVRREPAPAPVQLAPAPESGEPAQDGAYGQPGDLLSQLPPNR